MNRIKPVWLLAIVPFGVLALFFVIASSHGPFYLGSNSDPDYCYLLNSLNLLTFHAPAHTDHPGTTVQLLGAIVILGKWFLGVLSGGQQTIPEAVVTHPESFLHVISFFINLLIALALYFGARAIYRESGSFLAAALFQLSIFLFLQPALVQARVTPEPLSIATVLALAVPLAPYLSSRHPSETRFLSGATLAGILLGFGLVTKITFLPLLSVLVLFEDRKQKIRCLLSCAAASLVLLLPIFTQLPRTLVWFLSLVTHRGRYGSGQAGVPPLTEMWGNLTALATVEPFLFLLLLYYSIVLLALHFRKETREEGLASSIRRLLYASGIAIVLQVLMTVKHFALHYIVPCLLITAIANAAIVVLLSSDVFRGFIRRGLALFGLLLFLSGIIYMGSRRIESGRISRAYQNDIEALNKETRNLGDCVWIGSYGSSLKSYALAFGSSFSGGVHGTLLERLYPEAVTYDIFGGTFTSFTGKSMRSAVKQRLSEGRCVILQGMPLTPEASVGLNGFKVERVAIVRNEAVYRLGLGEANVLISEPAAPANAIVIEAEHLSASANVTVDTTFYGVGIGVITTPRSPAYAEYQVRLPAAGPYEIRLRCASAESRPLSLGIDGRTVSRAACGEPTGGYDPAHQSWQIAGRYELGQGLHKVRLERSGAFPACGQIVFPAPLEVISPGEGRSHLSFAGEQHQTGQFRVHLECRQTGQSAYSCIGPHPSGTASDVLTWLVSLQKRRATVRFGRAVARETRPKPLPP